MDLNISSLIIFFSIIFDDLMSYCDWVKNSLCLIRKLK